MRVYFGNGVKVFRRTFLHRPSGPVGDDDWTELLSDHADPADIGFGTDGTPILLATDGGVHATPDGGATWILTGGGRGGFNALQITEVTGQAVGGSRPHQDLYIGTQDNNLYASWDGGDSWGNAICCEGFFVRVDPPFADDHRDTQVSGVSCGSCFNFAAEAHFASPGAWPNPSDADSPSGDATYNPFLILPRNYIQGTVDGSVPGVTSFHLSRDGGSNWNHAYNIPATVFGHPLHISGGITTPTPYHPSIYHSVERPGTTATGDRRIGLVRARNLYGPGAVIVSRADDDAAGFGSLGIFPTEFAWYSVVGVNPARPDDLIIADVSTGQMKRSSDGGTTWNIDAPLTDLVTDGGRFRFHISQGGNAFPHAQVIAFDPYNECTILVGTSENGILWTGDGGITWEKFPLTSGRISNPSSFYFPPSGKVFISSYGRGLWTLPVPRANHGCTQLRSLPVAVDGPLLHDPTTGATTLITDFARPGPCSLCQYIVVRNGAITDLKFDGSRLTAIKISGGGLYQFDQLGSEQPLSIPNDYARETGLFGQNNVAIEIARARTPIRAILVDGDRLAGFITAGTELPFTPKRTPFVRAMSAKMPSGIATVRYGESLVVYGEGFASGPNVGPIRIRLGNRVLLGQIPADDNGTFRVQVSIRSPVGPYTLIVEQRDGKRHVQDRTTIKVVVGDEPGGQVVPRASHR
ncbi:MAG: hypothetical protein HZC37_18370 [Burkholderiales bacterium]|nr:hypothetical protein [Burkholderiales bacterium]